MEFGVYEVLTVAIMVVGAILGWIKTSKVKQVGEVLKAGMESIKTSVGPNDDTPGRVTPAEWAEAFEKSASKAKELLKDT